ncbi:hypothetical protein [Xylella fastidiosa]|uniref:hypothetical protein n=1 Tax=Xylella fastidiosa TaxID=2371 RepID=UPI003984DC3A
MQRILLGRDPKTEMGTGAIPGECIEGVTWARGVPELVDTVYVRHVSGERSSISLKSFDQGREKWQADTVDWGGLMRSHPKMCISRGSPGPIGPLARCL